MPMWAVLAAVQHPSAASLAEALLSVAAPLAGALLLSYAWVCQERATPLAPIGSATVRLWSFRRPGRRRRLQWTTLLGSLPGRFGLAMPLFALVLIRDPLGLPLGALDHPLGLRVRSAGGLEPPLQPVRPRPPRRQDPPPAPVPRSTILWGKWLGFGAWLWVQLLALTALLALGGRLSLRELTLGWLLLERRLALGPGGAMAQPVAATSAEANGLRREQPPLMSRPGRDRGLGAGRTGPLGRRGLGAARRSGLGGSRLGLAHPGLDCLPRAGVSLQRGLLGGPTRTSDGDVGYQRIGRAGTPPEIENLPTPLHNIAPSLDGMEYEGLNRGGDFDSAPSPAVEETQCSKHNALASPPPTPRS